MSKAEEATNDFCTRCFKYNKCAKVQSECVMADSYQEGYEDGYHQAEKDNKLTWKDIEKITDIWDDLHEDEAVYSKTGCDTPEFYQEVLKRFNEERQK